MNKGAFLNSPPFSSIFYYVNMSGTVLTFVGDTLNIKVHHINYSQFSHFGSAIVTLNIPH
jgi:hypothetical protein